VTAELQTPEISVVMGVYNAGPILRETLDSLLIQQECDVEVVVVDDGSTDTTARALEEYALRDQRVRVITQENRGLTRALVAGCAAARGRFIARQDAGDLSDERRLSVQREMLDLNPAVSFVSCATQYTGPEFEPLWITRPTGEAISAVRVIDESNLGRLRDGPTHHGSVMFRKEHYLRAGGYRSEFYYGQDFYLWYRLAEL
jgi:glycosyltransferase involved in cell wall biosynthesis